MRALIALVLTAFILATNGCTSLAPRPAGFGRSEVRPLVAHAPSDLPGNDEDIEKVRGHGGARVGLFIAGAVLIVGAVAIDIIILPATVPCRRTFCCTTTVVHTCYR